MAKRHLQAKFDAPKHRVEVGLDILTWMEKSIHYVYAPALDLTGYGKSSIEATESFEFQLNEFVNYTLNKGTVYDELERLGWTVNKRKKKVVAPNEVDLLEDNETYRTLSAMEGINKSSTNLALAL